MHVVRRRKGIDNLSMMWQQSVSGIVGTMFLKYAGHCRCQFNSEPAM